MNSGSAVRRAGLAVGVSLLVVSMGGPTAQAQAPGGNSGDGTVAAALATAPVPGGFATWSDLMGMQNKLNTAAEKIQQAAAASGRSGYASVIAAPENRELLVYWQGEVPAAVQRVIGEQNRSVPVRVLPARYNQEQLLAEVRRLGENDAVGEVAPRADGGSARGASTTPTLLRRSPGTARSSSWTVRSRA
ncbi:hypothetical protein ACOZ38_27410 [Sphaerisporangium viridialbum]|uniref:hypothetical protein n=1 Tax=Sphaerisporangium viridialbum TaxID=46189 RepID=UPI003C75D845